MEKCFVFYTILLYLYKESKLSLDLIWVQKIMNLPRRELQALSWDQKNITEFDIKFLFLYFNTVLVVEYFKHNLLSLQGLAPALQVITS